MCVKKEGNKSMVVYGVCEVAVLKEQRQIAT